MGRSTHSILAPAPLPYWLITVKVSELEKSLLVTWNVWRLFVDILTADDKYSLISKDNWKQTIQTNLSQKQNIFSQFFSAFFKSALNFEHFRRKMTLMVLYFWNYWHSSTCLDKCLKWPVWDDSSTGDMVNGPKHWFNLYASTFTILIDHCEGNWVGKVTLSDMKCLKTFC